MNPPKVSIQTLAYNCQDFLAETIFSIQEQTFQDWELIIIDDHSTDRTPDIAKRFAAEDDRIRYFRNEENLGIPRSRNRALKESRGEYIAVLDGDDVWIDDTKLVKQVEFLDENPAYGVVGTWAKNINEADEVIGENKTPQKDELARKTFFWKNQIVNSSSLFRKSAAEAVSGYDDSFAYSQDMELWLAIGKDWKFSNLPEFMTGYCTHGGNASLEKRRAQLRFNIQAMRRHGKHYSWGKYNWLLISLKKFYILTEPIIRPVVSFVRRLLSW